MFTMKNNCGAVFDLDGVLLDSESDLIWLYEALKKTLEYHEIETSEDNLNKIHPKNVHRFSEVCREFSIDAEELWDTRIRNYLKEKIEAMKNGVIKPFPDVNSLYELKGKYGMSIVSNSPQEIVDFFIEEFKFIDLFDCGIGRGKELADLKQLKPNSYMLERLKEKIHFGKLIYIGDSENDRKFAENTGMNFIHISRSEDIKDEFDTLDKIVNYLLNSRDCKDMKK